MRSSRTSSIQPFPICSRFGLPLMDPRPTTLIRDGFRITGRRSTHARLFHHFQFRFQRKLLDYAIERGLAAAAVEKIARRAWDHASQGKEDLGEAPF